MFDAEREELKSSNSYVVSTRYLLANAHMQSLRDEPVRDLRQAQSYATGVINDGLAVQGSYINRGIFGAIMVLCQADVSQLFPLLLCFPGSF